LQILNRRRQKQKTATCLHGAHQRADIGEQLARLRHGLTLDDQAA
jgi:hypothetical protein